MSEGHTVTSEYRSEAFAQLVRALLDHLAAKQERARLAAEMANEEAMDPRTEGIEQTNVSLPSTLSSPSFAQYDTPLEGSVVMPRAPTSTPVPRMLQFLQPSQLLPEEGAVSTGRELSVSTIDPLEFTSTLR